MELFSVIVILNVLLNYPIIDEEYNFLIKNSDINYWIIILVVVIYLIIFRIQTRIKIRRVIIFLILFYIIRVQDFVRFFVIYEIVFILIIFAILLLGYSYERLIAGYIILFYSFIFSSPTLFILIMIDYSFLIKNWLRYSNLLLYFLVASFIVKFPIFSFHYWLPVAHVEASTLGSMVLAGILLKIGGLGVFYVVIYIQFLVKFHWLGLIVCIVILIILIIRDLKIMIAYSSVAHITLVFYIIILGRTVGKQGWLIIIFYHGFISPLIFWLVGMIAWWKTRSLLVIKMIRFSGIFLFCVFVLIIMNIRFPPFIGFLSEIFMLKSLIILKRVLYIVILRVLFRCYYNIYLFWCFTNLIGIVFKVNFFNLDLFLFLLLVLILNF